MFRLKTVMLCSALFILPLFLLAGCSLFKDSSYRDAETIEYDDVIFYPDKSISIPLQVKREGVSQTLFKIKENTAQLADRLESVVSPQIMIREENENYIVIEVRDGGGQVSNGIIFEVTNDELFDPMDGWHYYVIDGFCRDVASAEAKYTGCIYWPVQYFPLHFIGVPLVSGQEYETEAAIDDFEAFYQNVSEQQGISFERKGNTIILPKEFLYGNQELRAVLTFEEGTVKVDLVY